MNKEWSTTTRYFVFALVLAGCIWFITAAQALISAIAISALLAYLLNPIVTLVNERARVARSLVVFLVYLLSLGAIVTVTIIFVPAIPEQTASFLADMQVIMTQAQEDYFSEPITVLNTSIDLNGLMPEADLSELVSSFIRADIIVELLQTSTTNLGWILVVLVATYYLLQDWGKLRDWLFSWAPEPFESDVRKLYEQIKLVWNRYFRGQLRLSIIVGLLTGAGSLIMGLPGALLFGVFAAIFDVLLSVGPAIIMAIATIVALLAGSNTLDVSNGLFAVVVLTFYLAIQGIENIWLRPRIMSSSVRIHPAIIFIAIVGSLSLAGVLTALIIVPVLGSIAVISRYTYFKLFKMDPWADNQTLAARIIDAGDKKTAESPGNTALKSTD
ncbi:MAG: AI-2E family transporter [Ardenticatenaceae bacterium]|nr:AI-2E family transporter [Anaerolineales bacterium]MCB9009699.1 AI-2E family transporter [Ardenticatenaceae bacterium]